MSRFAGFVLVLWLGFASGAQACGERAPGDTRPRIGLALGGGGARGIAHVSVLEALEARHIRPDCIAGTSMGSLVGALYSSGMPVADIRKLVLELDWKALFDDSLARPERSVRRKEEDRLTLTRVGVGVTRKGVRVATGVLAGQRILLLLEKLTLPVSAIADFDDLPIPFRAIATDLNTGTAVVIGEGSLAMAMRASMSLPGIFEPVVIDGRVLLDGGLANQVPIDVVREMGADIVVAVDVGTPLNVLEANASLLSVLDQMVGMMTVGNTRAMLATLGDDDLLIAPALGTRVATGDFDKGELALSIGREAVVAESARLDALAALVDPATLPPAVQAEIADVVPLPRVAPVVEFVRLENRTGYDDRVFLSRIAVPVGRPLDPVEMDRQLQRAYGIDTFSVVYYEVVTEDGRTGVVIHAAPKAYGPNYLQFGLSFNSDFSGSYGSNLRGGLLFAPLTPYGAEARVIAQVGSEPGIGAEYYHPLDPLNRNILFARGQLEARDISVFDDDNERIALYDAPLAYATLGYAREFGGHGALSLSYRGGVGKADVEIGDPSLPDFDFEVGEVRLGLALDRLDNLYFPRDGYLASLAYVASRESIGADADFDQVDLDALYAHRFGRHALQFAVRYHETVEGLAPVQSLYRLGGTFRLAGYRANELTGQHYALVAGGYLYQLADVFTRSAFAGGTVEYGNAWQLREDIGDDPELHGSVYFGFDSWVGPIIFGYGAREGGDGTLFLEIGRPF